MKKVFLIAAIAAASVLSVSAQTLKEQDPEKHVVRTFPSTEKHLSFYSNILGCEKNFSVILPASYDKEPGRSYPVLYLLHGAGENDWEWANINVAMIRECITMSVADGACAEMIVVKPNANEAGKQGYFNQEGWRYEDYFFQELIPAIEKNFRVIADKGHRAIAGLSMGGGGSFYYGVKHPDMFSSVYAISAAVGSFASSNSGTFSAGVDINNLTDAQKEAINTVAITLDCGDDDFLFDGNVATYQALKKQGINCQFRVREGTHATYYWYEGLHLALKFATRHFSEQCK